MMTPRERKSRNEWIHGGKYIKPSTSRLPQTDECFDNDGASRDARTGHDVSLRCKLGTRAQELIRWMYPLLECSIRTLLAFFVTMIGAMVVGITMLRRWKREHATIAPADRSNSEEIASQANTQLERAVGKASVSPVEKSVTLPTLPIALNLSVQRATTTPATTTPETSIEQPPPKSAPPASAMRSRNVNTATPRSARRVLFSETEQGEVSTTKIHYDKDLPASARKLRNNYGSVINDHGLLGSSKDSPVSPKTSAAAAACGVHFPPINANNTTFTPTNNHPIAQVNELPWQNPIDPTMQSFPLMKNKSTNDPRFNIGAKLSPSYNPKRKRRELIGAISRWNRNRQGRVVSNRPFLIHGTSTNFLAKSNSLKRRRDQQEMDQIDQCVWRAMNDATEKENLNGAGGKRAKGSSAEGAEFTVRSVMTPWKSGR